MAALGGGWPMFGVDYVSIAVLELLQADPILQQATNGRIERRHIFTGDAELAYPILIVAALGVNEIAAIGQIKADIRIGVLYCFSQFTKPLATGIGQDEPSIGSLQTYLLSLLPSKAVNDKVTQRFPNIGNAKTFAATSEFGRFDPIPIQDKNSIVAFAVGIEMRYAQWTQYPSRLPA